MQHDDDREHQEWADLVWMKYSQRLDVDEAIGEHLDRRAAEADAFEAAIASLREEGRIRVVVVDVPLDERLAAAHRVRVDCRTGVQERVGE